MIDLRHWEYLTRERYEHPSSRPLFRNCKESYIGGVTTYPATIRQSQRIVCKKQFLSQSLQLHTNRESNMPVKWPLSGRIV